MNLTMPNYFKMVGFHRLSQKEQIMHLLFFVTVVAELRRDMTARIIADRLQDQKQILSASSIENILETDKYHFAESAAGDQRDRHQGERAFYLTNSAKNHLKKVANLRFAKLRYWSRPQFMIPFLLGLALSVIAIGLLSYHYATVRDVSDISWPSYRTRLEMESATPQEKSKLILYFITVHIRYRHDMTPQIISDRIKDVGLGEVAPKLIESYFKSNPKTFVASNRLDAYSLTDEGIAAVKKKLAFNPTKDDGSLGLRWFLEYELNRASLMIPALIAGAIFIWTAASAYARLNNFTENLVINDGSD